MYLQHESLNQFRLTVPFLRKSACNAITRLSYRRDVHVCVCVSGTLLYYVRTMQVRVTKYLL